MAGKEESLVEELLRAKSRSGKSFTQIASEMGLTNAYVGQLFYRQARLLPEHANSLEKSVPSLSPSLLAAMEVPPVLALDPQIFQDPTIYRLKEIVMHYGESLSKIITEDFGDGEISASDFSCDLQKAEGEDGEERVKVTMNAKFLRFYPDDHEPLIREATVVQMQEALRQGTLTSRKIVEYYIYRVSVFDRQLHAVIELAPDALQLADEADAYRREHGAHTCVGLRGIPVLLKDNIATADKLKTTAGSRALLGSVVSRDAGVVSKLRNAGAIIFGKANLSEWMNFRSPESVDFQGWSARGGQTINPYDAEATTSGSSSGSAVGVSANLVAVSLGTETNASIISPASMAAVVGFKPSVGLTSRAGVIPLSLNQDTVGPICRTVADAVEVLDVIVGVDERDSATSAASALIPPGGYKQFLTREGLRGKRLGVLTGEEFVIDVLADGINKLLSIAEDVGAILIRDLELPYAEEIVAGKSELVVLQIDFKHDLEKYLAELEVSQVRNLQDVIDFNEIHKAEELSLFGQETFLEVQARSDDQQSHVYREALERNKFLTEKGLDFLFKQHNLDAVVATTASRIASPAAIAGYPAITIPAGYFQDTPYGICFVGMRGSEGVLIEIAYALEQEATIRRQPFLRD